MRMRIVPMLALLVAVLLPQGASAECAAERSLAAFVGSSSIAKWGTLAKDFPLMCVINFGVEGSAQLPDGQMIAGVKKLIDEVISWRPKVVVLYVGENDLWVGNSPEEVHGAIREVTKQLEAALPEVRIVYISLKPSPRRWNIVGEIVAVDRMLQEDAWTDPRLSFADVFSWMLDERGEVRSDLFTPDGLHMNEFGYAIWTHVVTEALK